MKLLEGKQVDACALLELCIDKDDVATVPS